MYGSHFARLPGLAEKSNYYDPIVVQIPPRYRPLFTEGCETAAAVPAAAKFNGAVVHNGRMELYRAAFMPLRLRVDSLRPIGFGSFNYRSLARVPEPLPQR